MGQAEIILLAAIIGIVSVVWMGTALIRAIWNGRPPRRVPFAVALGLVVVAMVTLGAHPLPAAPVLVASASESSTLREPQGEWPVMTLVASGARLHLAGTEPIAAGEGVWAVAEDPRTGAAWLQGPAMLTDTGWRLDAVLGTATSIDVPLSYRVSIVAVPAALHATWLAQTADGAAHVMSAPPSSARWLAHDLAVTVPDPR
ncbi:MAG: hypothetical protein QOF51_648 [Chloroflexota bacterium]|jgi:hypothetical protein|nr:hypothetical protein [Chloroflexota bacterium]